MSDKIDMKISGSSVMPGGEYREGIHQRLRKNSGQREM